MKRPVRSSRRRGPTHAAWLLCAAALFTLAGTGRTCEAGSAALRPLVLTSGKVLAVQGKVEMTGRLMVFHLEDGTLVSLKGDQIDQAATRAAVLRPRPSGPARPAAAGTRRVSSGPGSPLLQARVSLDLKDADVVDVLRFLADQAGMNLVISDQVKGTVTLRLVDVRLEDALHVILKTMNLGIDTSNSSVPWIAPRDQLLRSASPGR